MKLSNSLSIPEDIIEVCNAIERFIQSEVIPRHERYAQILDEPLKRYQSDGSYVPQVRTLIKEIQMSSAQAGFYTMCVPKELGGEGMGYLAWYMAWDRISRVCGGQYWLGNTMLAHWATGPSAVLQKLSSQQKAECLPALMDGSKTLCFGMSEPDAGSDALRMRTKAVKIEGGWKINGSKIWTTNSPYADYCILFAVTDVQQTAAGKGISCFLVPTNSLGFEVQRIIKLWGHPGGNEAVLLFNDVFVPDEYLVGELNDGFSTAMLGVNLGRIYNSSRALAWGEASISMAFDYSKQRHAFGEKIANYQAVTFPLAESLMDIHCARVFALNVCRMLDEGQKINEEMAIMKHQAVKASILAVERAMQAHGAIGMTNEMHLAEIYLTLRTLNIADGTNEILKRTLVKSILSGKFNFGD